ncbi:uncharacterized protein LOC132040269 isoform X1 [Lycium ferocissimum]|uniref:uncharacterized protein LOC132040269 isoform X1 n=1 Tax=Lycium ferocissimum TaxID=112874 RepID=UPI00281611AD|nr:uncharacterized protein LOC132040269 isoform X1 [Lycium ferocissimum]
MGGHSVLCADLTTAESSQSLQGAEDAGSTGGSSYSHKVVPLTSGEDEEEPEAGGEEEPLVQTVECRICQEEDSSNNVEIPCSCSGSLKYAHRKCVQRWCNEKGDIICEICHQPYQPGYTAPPPPPPSEETVIDISGGWTVAGTQVDLNDPRLLSMAERHLQEADHDEYADASASGAAFCRSAALFLMALLLMRHAFENGEGDHDDVSAFFSLFLLRAAGFLLPCFIMAWGISILQRRRQRQQEAAAEVAFLLQAGQQRGLHVTIAPRPAPPAEPSAATDQATIHVSTAPRQVEVPRPEIV